MGHFITTIGTNTSLPPPFFTPRLALRLQENATKNYGFSAGGPIIKNKTFVFLSYEKNDFVFGLSGIATEPSDAWVNQALAVLAAHGVAESAASKNAIGRSGFWPRGTIGSLPATTGNFFSPSSEFGYSYNGVARMITKFLDKHHLSLHALSARVIRPRHRRQSGAGNGPARIWRTTSRWPPLHDGNYGGS